MQPVRDPNKDLGKRIAQERARLGLSQDKLAELLGDDATQTKVSRWEAGDYPPEPKHLVRLAKVLSRSLDDLLNLPTPLPPGHFIVDLDAARKALLRNAGLIASSLREVTAIELPARALMLTPEQFDQFRRRQGDEGLLPGGSDRRP